MSSVPDQTETEVITYQGILHWLHWEQGHHEVCTAWCRIAHVIHIGATVAAGICILSREGRLVFPVKSLLPELSVGGFCSVRILAGEHTAKATGHLRWIEYAVSHLGQFIERWYELIWEIHLNSYLFMLSCFQVRWRLKGKFFKAFPLTTRICQYFSHFARRLYRYVVCQSDKVPHHKRRTSHD